ncbi:MAG: CotH kinase family protein, partial [Prevotella sp.]|nr:CotH kinase family protein [Prevotella sp.]
INKEKKAKTGTQGQFVELILNDEYRGIYCMTENMDRKQMKLKKIDEATETNPETTTHGQLWKSKDWTYATLMGTSPDGGYQPKYELTTPNPNSEMWDKYQVKYPDFEDYGNKTDWTTLYNAVDFVCHSSDEEFIQHFAEYFDLPLVIDYYILQECILSTDNHGKNMFFACYDVQTDKKITFGVWDMDATCGQRWSDDYFHSSLMQPEQDYSEYIARNEHGDYNLFKRLRNTDAEDFNMQVRLRYRDLRDNYLATESVLNRFSTYLNRFKLCGAAQREYDKWNGDTDISRLNLDFDDEMEYLTDWITRRLNYLDTQRFDIGSLPPSGVNSMEVASQNPRKVYNMSGQQVGTTDQLKQLPAGIYIVAGKKVVVNPW